MPMKQLKSVARKVEASLKRRGVVLTMGGEPSYVPTNPTGAEWNVAAVGPTKLNHGYAMARALIEMELPGAMVFFSPGKCYPGEINPRWALHVLSNRDGSPLHASSSEAKRGIPSLSALCAKITKQLKVPNHWHEAAENVRVLPLDHDGTSWRTERWPIAEGKKINLLNTSGPAGLRLPLAALPDTSIKRALVLERLDGELHIFLPPLLQEYFLPLLGTVGMALGGTDFDRVFFEGYIPSDERGIWEKITFSPDPGVLEINLPPCKEWTEYAKWMIALEKAATAAGLRSSKQSWDGSQIGTGGGNHILFGGATLDAHPLFSRPRWIISILRFWQHHPSLAYLFTGQYVGSSSQAPRPDESARELYDVEMAYRFLEGLQEGTDHRALISETLRHLHCDTSGNTHRSETSFDKFWNAAWDGGCRGLIEFRAIETLPHAEWMAAVGLLWRALFAHLLNKPFHKPLREFGSELQDHYFLPCWLWSDFSDILKELRNGGFDLPEEIYRGIFEWRFPLMLQHVSKGAALTVRKACESWPLLCETPLEGGNTSRFVDTSIERVEFLANAAFAKTSRIFIQGRELPLESFPDGHWGAGLRYRRTALYPSLHPGIAPHLPLVLEIERPDGRAVFQLEVNSCVFESTARPAPRRLKRPVSKLKPHFLTRDLRLK